ncbi:MAG: hypothetical protein RML12_00665 [Xanthomonadales bacterium]|nr:hypothetical protein [Xanthomonadales bacterium]
MAYAHRLLRSAAVAAALFALGSGELLAFLPGKNGNRTVTAANTVLNQYALLAASASVGALSITVTNISDLNSPEPVGGGPLAAGDLILIYQARGATIDTSASHLYGSIVDYGSAGRYEIRSVAGVSGNTISIEPVNDGASCVGLRYAFDAAHTQVVRIPQYQNLDVQAGGSVVAQAWDGARGGIVALFVNQTLTVNGAVHADGRGFRGGVRENNDRPSGGTSPFAFRSNDDPAGGHKGEGIASLSVAPPGASYSTLPFSNPGGSFDEAAPANGGGGGGSHNGGGGGGANVAASLTPYCTAGTATYDATNPAITWCGQGIMPTTVPGAAAWTLDPAYIANGNAHTQHVGGGRGGYTFAFSNQNALTLPPGNSAWTGDFRRAKGGWGGRPLAYTIANRVFFGGGGGAGAMNNNAGGSGGAGGGLVLIRAGSVAGSGQIRADGAAGANSVPGHNDGPGGGGAGGTVLLRANGGSFSGTVRANGGDGGNQLITNDESEGPGGGGGGGLVAVAGLSGATLQAAGGSGGTTTSAAVTEFPRNGATDGAPGVTSTAGFSLFEGCPQLGLSKTITSGSPYSAPGNVINYQIVATNTGNVPLTNVSITDPLLGTLSCTPAAPATLNPGQTLTCTGSYTVTQANVDAGSVTNTANASGTAPGGGTVNAPPASATATANQNPALALAKTITSGSPFNAAGNVINYQIVATNTGNVTLTNVSITDPLLGTLSCTPAQPTTLAPGQTLTCTGSYTVTQANVDAGSVTNTANASGTAPGGATVNAPPASATATASQNPALGLAKTITSGSPFNAAGNVINYQIVATNTGNVTLTNVSITDPLLGTLSCTPAQPATLAPGQTLTCTGSYTVTQANVDAGSVTNTANASGTAPGGATVNAPPASATAVANQNPALGLAKTITSGSPYSAAGNVISYQLVATNTGNVTLTNVSITDPLLGTLSCTPAQPATLAPGQTLTCTGSYTVTQANVDAGSVTNTANASGTAPGGATVNAPPASATAVANQNPALGLTKTITSGNPYSAAGQVIGYQLVATNTGNVTLTNVSITDPLLGTLSCTPAAPATLAPGQALTCTGSYTVTVADVNNGSVTNTANASGTAPGGGTVNAPPASATATATQNPSLALSKTVTSGSPYSAPGNVINYQIVATNIGNVTLTNVTITDPLLGTLSCTPAQPATLNPGQTLTCTGSYTVTQANVDAGSVTNTANASGTRPGGGQVNAPPAQATAVATQNPALNLLKTITSGSPYSAPGNVIGYQLVATNTGNVTLTSVSITDPLLGTLSCTPAQPTTLAPGQTLTCTGSYTVTQANVDAGSVNNTATVTGTRPGGGQVSANAQATATATQNPGLGLTKAITSGSPFNAAGQVINYQLVATNTGNVTLTNVSITDPLLGTLSCTPAAPATLAPGQTLTCTGSYTVTQANVDAGVVNNTANASGTRPGGGQVSAPPASASATGNQNPGLSLTKSITAGNPFSAAGQVISYQLVATNTGNVTLSNVSITDPLLGTLSCTPAAPATLAPGQTLTCTGSYTVTQANVDAGSVTNTANASGTRPGGGQVNAPPASATATSSASGPAIQLVKTATLVDSNGNGLGDVGETVNYTLVATNTGGVTLSNVTISDPLLPSLTCTPPQPAVLAPTQTLTCTGSRVINAADVIAGNTLTNVATAQGRGPAPGNVIVTSTSTAVVTLRGAGPPRAIPAFGLPALALLALAMLVAGGAARRGLARRG